MRLAWAQMTAQFGVPQTNNHDGPGRRAVKVCAVGYGKLGGNELGYASDLDLVFLHDAGSGQSETDAAKPVDIQVFFIRFAQRVIHLLTMHSSAGRLYESTCGCALGQGRHVGSRASRVRGRKAWTWGTGVTARARWQRRELVRQSDAYA
jgi:glutamate-ammonia-ligase adenylyltransferase